MGVDKSEFVYLLALIISYNFGYYSKTLQRNPQSFILIFEFFY